VFTDASASVGGSALRHGRRKPSRRGDGANLLRPRLGRARRLGGVAERRSVALGFRIGVGSRGECDDRAGIRHLNEHLLFEGSYHAQEIAETFDAVGAELNAATSREHTVAVTVTNG